MAPQTARSKARDPEPVLPAHDQNIDKGGAR